MRGIASPARLVALALTGGLALIGGWSPAVAAASTHRRAEAMGGRFTKAAGHVGQGRAVEDLDGDGLTNWTERERTKTYPRKADSDGDGLGDGVEVNRTRTDPLKADTDSDGLGDGTEVNRTRTDPLTADTDGDGLGDGIEVNSTKTNPRKADTDGDGYSDRDEVIAGSNPRDRSSVPAKPPPVILPKAVWTAPSGALAGVPVTLDGTASTGSGPLACAWSFENADGSIVWQTRDGCLIEFTFESTGTKYVRLTVTGPAGGTSANKRSIEVAPPPDTTPPDTSIDSSPASPTEATGASFTFNSSESGSSFQCKLDSGSWADCASPQSYSGLTVADHSFSVRATDAAGNIDSSPATYAWTVADPTPPPPPPPPPPPDTTPPDTSIDSSPASPTEATSASFSFSSSESGSSFQCQLDSGSWADCASPQSYSGLTVADHTFSVRATDAAGNVDDTPASATWTVEAAPPPPPDTTPPDTSIDSSPASPTEATSASFAFSASEAGSTFQCKLDSGSWTNCASPQSYSGLSVADHTFSVRATDAAGNVDGSPATRSWTIQAPPPPPPPPPPPSSCATGATNATTAAAVRSAVSAGKSACVTADVGDVDFSNMGNRSGVVISTSGGSMGHLNINSTSGLTIRSARFRSVEIRGGDQTTIADSTIGGTPSNRTYDQLIFMPDRSDNVVISNNDIGWTLADNSGNTGYGCRCYGVLNNFKFVGNRVHDIAADGLQGFNGTNQLIDRNNIGPVGANPGSSEHSDIIQIVSNNAGMQVTNNWLHDQGYFRPGTDPNGPLQKVGNAGNIYIHGGSTGSLLFQNNLLSNSEGRTDICGLGTGGISRSNLTMRNNTWTDLGRTFTGFPGFSWQCTSGSGNVIRNNVAVDPDGGFALIGNLAGVDYGNNLFGNPSLVTLDPQGNCTSANCNPSGAEPIGYRKPSGVNW